MTGPFSPPGQTPRALPPNRERPRAGLTAIVWIVLVLMLWAVFQVSGRPRASAPVHGGTPAGWLLPLAAYLGMIAALAWLRAQLPARYRTGELRELPKPAPPPSESPPPYALALEGDWDGRKVRLTVDDAGFCWWLEARLLQPESELRFGWEELEAVAIAGRRARGRLELVTRTHRVSIESRELDEGAREGFLAAVRARAPRAAPDPSGGRGAFAALFLDPFADLARATWSNARLARHLARAGNVESDEEARVAGRLQIRMYSLWSGVLRGLGPLSTAVGAALAQGQLWSAIAWAAGAWVLGLLVIGRSMEAFARFTGMSLLR